MQGMKQDRRRARAIAIAEVQKSSEQHWLRLGFLTGAVLLAVGLVFSLVH